MMTTATVTMATQLPEAIAAHTLGLQEVRTNWYGDSIYGNTNYPKGMFLKIDSRLCDGGGCVALYTNAGDDAFLWMKSLHNSINRSRSQDADHPKIQTKAARMIRNAKLKAVNSRI